MAPDLLGNDARGMFNIPGLESMADKHRLAFRDVRMIGGDLRLSLDIVAPKPASGSGPGSDSGPG